MMYMFFLGLPLLLKDTWPLWHESRWDDFWTGILMQVIYMSDSEDEELEASLVLGVIPELEPFQQGHSLPTRVLQECSQFVPLDFFNVDFGESQISPWNDELVTGARMFEASNRCVRNFPATWIPQRLDKLILQELYYVKCRFIGNSPFPHGESPGVIKNQIARKSFFNLLILFVNICLVISF